MAKVKEPRGHNFELHINCGSLDACHKISMGCYSHIPPYVATLEQYAFLKTPLCQVSQARGHKNNSGGH